MALVVEHGDGSTLTRCIAFGGSSLTGEEVLAQSGIPYKTVSFGGLSDAVCQVDDEPLSYPPTCWTSDSKFWELFVARKGGTWSSSSLGVSTQVFHDGDSEGLRYEPQAQVVPPSTMGNCPAPTPTPRPTPRPTATPIATPHPAATTASGSPPTAGSAAPSPIEPATLDSPAADATGSLAPTGGVEAAVISPAASLAPIASSGPPPSSGDDGSAALVVAVLAIVGLTGLAVARRRPRRVAGTR